MAAEGRVAVAIAMGWESLMLRARETFMSRAVVATAIVATLFWSLPTASWAQVVDPRPDPEPTGDATGFKVADGPGPDLSTVTPAADPAQDKSIQPQYEPAPDSIPAGGSRATVTFTIRNLNSNYFGGGRTKLNVGDKVRINHQDCAASDRCVS